MKRYFVLTLFTYCFALNSSFADTLGFEPPVEPVKGIHDWLDGCAELSNTTSAAIPKMVLDQGCVTQGLDYCVARKTPEFERVCQIAFINLLSFRSHEISNSLPDNPSLSGFADAAYERALTRASRNRIETCANQSELDCQMLDEILSWLDLRHAQRLLEKESK